MACRKRSTPGRGSRFGSRRVCLFGPLWPKKALPILAFLLSCASGSVLPERSTILPEEEMPQVLRLCSRSGPSEVKETWLVSRAIVEQLEHDLPRLARLKSRECCILGARVRNPGSYFRQYVGVVVGGRSLVYINAFRSDAGHPNWHRSAVDVCDGGNDYWGAFYDPVTRRFSRLAFNGSA